MAKRIVDEEMKFDVIINGNSAQKELQGLEKSTRKLTEENKALGLQKSLLEKQNKTESEEYKSLTAAINANSKEIRTNQERMRGLRNEIGVNGMTMAQLTKRASELRLALRNAIPGTENFERYTAELRQIDGRLGELRNSARATQGTLSSMADKFNKYQALFASFVLGITGVVLSLQQMIDYNGKLADAQSNVMKTTKMTKAEVDELTKSFGVFQTRTSRIDLLKIAEEGGRIGIAKDDIAAFTEEMNKANVALGDSFTGGASEVASKLGKLKFLFQETKDMDVGEAYNKIGSAINELGADGVASEANIADFATRLGSLNDALKPSIQEALALGAAFEESGIESEVAARAYSIFLNQASTNTGKFAKVMNLTQKQVTDMINDNPMEFFLKFSEGLKGMDATDVATTLDYLGVSADGANKALGAVANNGKRFRDQIELSNKQFELGSSLTDEYNIKNNNLAATLEKIKKAATGWLSSEGLIDWLTSCVDWIGKVIGATDDVDGSGAKWRNGILLTVKILAVLIVSLFGYNAGLRLAALLTNGVTMSTTLLNLAVKAQAIGIAFARLGLTIYTGVMGFFGVATDKASASLARMNLVTRASPWGAILMLITAVVAAYVLFSEKTKEAATRSSILNETMREADQLVRTQTSGMRALLTVAQDKTLDDKVRLQAIKELNKQYPEFNNNLTLENINTAEGKRILDDYIKSLHRKAELQILQKRQSALLEQISAKENMSLEEEIDLLDEAWAYMKNFGNASTMSADLTVLGSKRKTEALKKLQAELKLTDAEMKKMLANNPGLMADVGGEGGKSTYTVPVEEDKGAAKVAKKAEDERKRRLELLEKYKADLLALERKTIDGNLALMKEGYEKEIALEKENHRRKLEDLQLQKKSENDFKELDKQIAVANKSGDKGLAGELIAQKKHWEDVNKHINSQIESENQAHVFRLGTITERGAANNIKAQQEKYQQEKIIRQTAFLSELNAIQTLEAAKAKLKEMGYKGNLKQITTLEDAKAALQEQFNQEEMKVEEKHLREILAIFDEIVKMNGGQMFDLTLLTPEQLEKFKAMAAEMNLTLEELIANINKTKGGKSADLNDPSDAIGAAMGETDILGFSQEQWDLTLNNFDTLAGKLSAANMLIGTMQQLWAAYDQYLTATENAQLKQYEKNNDRKKNALKRQLESGEISQGHYNRSVERMDAEADKKKAEIEYKQAKRQKTMAIVDVIVKTAMAIMQGYAQLGPIGGTIAAVLIGTLGALQISTIKKQPLPAKGYEKGLYPGRNGTYPIEREQDGKVFNATYGGTTTSGVVTKPTYFLTGENGPEMILDAGVYSNMNPEVRNSLHREVARLKGYENGMYPTDVPKPDFTPNTTSPDPVLHMAIVAALNRNSEIMEKIYEEGLSASIDSNNEREMNKLRKGIDSAAARRNLNKF